MIFAALLFLTIQDIKNIQGAQQVVPIYVTAAEGPVIKLECPPTHCDYYPIDGCFAVEKKLESAQWRIRDLTRMIQENLTEYQQLMEVVRRCPPLWFKGRDDNGDGLIQLNEFAAVQLMIEPNWKGQ